MAAIGIRDVVAFLSGIVQIGVFLIGLAMVIYGLYLGWQQGFPLS